ncbi:MAG: hypothetical protein WC342_04015 [Methanoregula sp.]|jgi:hypothetical protein
MKKVIFLVLSILCILCIFLAGCTSDAGNSNAGSTPSPTLTQHKFNSGDVLAKDDSSVTITVAVASYDAATDSYKIYDVSKNSNGGWQSQTNPSQRTLTRTAVEKIYPKKIARVGSTSNVVQSTVQSTYSTTYSTTSSSSSSGVQIRITYSGLWSGAYGDAGSMQSIDGTGSKTITLDNPSSIISTSFQKKDNSPDELKVEILKNGQVLKSGSTTASYGVVAVASSIYGGTSSYLPTAASSKIVQIKVYYDGLWQGAYGEVGAMQSVDGSGSQTYTITNPNYAVSTSFQKKDNSNSELRVEIVKDGSVIKTGSTTAAYGVVLVSSTV